MKERLLKIRNACSAFVGSEWFIALNAALIFLGWFFDIWVPMLAVIAVLDSLPLFFDRQTKPLFNLLMMFSFIMSADRGDIVRYAPVLSVFAVTVVGMVFNLIFFKRSLLPIHPKNLKGFNATLIALIFPFAFAGISSPAEDPIVTVTFLAMILLFGAVYSFFTVTCADDEAKGALPDYVIKILFASGIVVALEMIVYYARVGDINGIVQAMMEKKVDIGWAGPNNMAPLLSMAVPASFYFCLKKNYSTPLFATIALVEYALIISTGCRSSILFTTLAMSVMVFYVIVKSENKLAFGITVSVVFMVAIVLVAYYGNIFANIIASILNKRLDSSGRDELYRLAVDAFKTWPIFGAGWDYKRDMFFQSTFFQVMATMGLFGLVMFAIFYFWRYRTFFKMRKEPTAIALFCSMALFEANAFIDTNYFLPNFFIILMIMTFAVEINLPDDSCRAFGGKDPVAHVVGFFRIITDKVKPAKPAEPHDKINPKEDESNDETPRAEE